MKISVLLKCVALSAFLLVFCTGNDADISARKVTTKLKAPKPEKRKDARDKTLSSANGSEFEMIADKLNFLAYDKRTSAGKETFFVENGSETEIKSMEVEISYFINGEKLIHSRKVTVNGPFPPHETRKVDIKSWDTQKSFHYAGSAASKSGSTPYIVKFRILTLSVYK